MDINNNHFTAYLRRALNHLYEPDLLRLSPLTAVLGLADRIDASSALQKILLQSIEDIRPEDQESQQSQASMIYEVLFFRYVRGYSREAVANQLGISDRQLSREQRTAIETLAQLIWNTYQLDGKPQEPYSSLPYSQGNDFEATSMAAPWFESVPSKDPFSWKVTLNSVIELIRPLLRENQVTLHCESWDDLADLLVPHATLRHSMLTVLGWIVPQAHQGEVRLTPIVEGQKLAIRLEILGQFDFSQSVDPGIEIARQLVERIDGSLEKSIGKRQAEIKLTLPAFDLIPVLVVEDNADTIQLFQRYVQGSRYSVIGVQDPTDTLRQAERIKPRIILLDVMMPQLDGWEILAQLRMSGIAQNISILICSILPQESLALSLGADGFIQKPVLPQNFLNALDRVITP